LTGGHAGDAQNDLDKALAAISQVQTPTADEMKFQLQKLVSAGVLTPQKAQFYLANPSAYMTEVIPQLGTQAQESTIQQLESDAQAGGVSATEEAKMQDIIRELNTQEKGQRDAILQNAAARGTLTGGETLAAQLEGNQADVTNANQRALGSRAEAEQLALQELTTAGGMGATLQGQENTQANMKAAAVDAISKFNAAQEQGTENFNVGNENAARAANLENAQRIGDTNITAENAHELQQSQLPQEVYQDALAKAQSEAGIYGQKAGLDTSQGQQMLDIYGGITNAVSPAIGKAFDKVTAPAAAPASGASTAGASGADSAIMAASEGGEIHDYLRGGLVKADKPGERAVVPGNSPRNDKIPADLSEGEVVLPRTVAQPALHGQPDKVMEFLNRMRKPRTPHPEDVASVLHAMGRMREVA
jgi:hypothetical protein